MAVLSELSCVGDQSVVSVVIRVHCVLVPDRPSFGEKCCSKSPGHGAVSCRTSVMVNGDSKEYNYTKMDDVKEQIHKLQTQIQESKDLLLEENYESMSKQELKEKINVKKNN